MRLDVKLDESNSLGTPISHVQLVDSLDCRSLIAYFCRDFQMIWERTSSDEHISILSKGSIFGEASDSSVLASASRCSTWK